MASTMQFIDEAVSVGVSTISIGFNKALKAILRYVRSDTELGTKVIKICEVLADSVQHYPVYLSIAPE